MIVVSRFTPNGRYPEYARALVASCERFGLPHDVQAIPDPGSWDKGIDAKTQWITNILLGTRQAILWLDVDCEIKALPAMLLGCSCDFAVYNFAADPENGHGIAYDPEKLVSATGVLYLAYTAPVIELMIRWIWAMKQHPELRGGDPALDQAYNTCRPPVNPLWLPRAYNRMDSIWPDVLPVIDHHYCQGKLRDAG